MNCKNFFLKVMCAAMFVVAFGASQAFAQPTDAQIKKHLSGPKVISTTLHKPGKKVWSSTYSKYVWDIGFTNKVKDSDNPGLFIYVDGIASFDIIGGRYVFWRTFSGDVRYEGIPNPTAAEVQSLIKQFGIEKFLGNYYDSVVGKVESMELAGEPKFEWHTPNSVSFNVVAVYTEKISNTESERVSRTFRIRLYRDDKKSAWANLMSDALDAEKL